MVTERGSIAESWLDVAALTRFFDESGRDLPWREPQTEPWHVLISEVMLQQTPVARVLPVYRSWVERWPTPARLAEATPADAVRAWGRLGYPRRALRLHEAARAIVRDHGGAVPHSLESLLALPGVGQYTARAVAAFAFGIRQPVIDTNVRRVLSRAVRGVDEHGPATATDRADLDSLLPADADLAVRTCAALMELGALICTATSPACDRCPLADTCSWRALGYPPGPPRRSPAQRWHGTDRKMRGEILAVLRDASAPMDADDLAARTASYLGNEAQWRRCLQSLAGDGLIRAIGAEGREYCLPGDEQPGSQQPGREQAAVQQSGSQQPASEQAAVPQSGREQPRSQQPGREQPGSEQPRLRR